MSKSPAAHPAVAFAAGYSTSSSTLNASAAMFRCEAFLHDIELAEVAILRFRSSGEWTPSFGLEIFSYYLVGFVTCVEWHARSRLVNLFTFKPSCIKVEDLKGNISDKVLSQMVAAKVGVPEVMGASLSIGSPEAYFSTIFRVFAEIGIPRTQAEVLSSLKVDSADNPMETLQDLFQHRHRLVHEISMGEVGSWMIRDNVDLEEAKRFGNLVLNLMKLVEREITAHAPRDFPNRLTVDGVLEDPSDFLDREIARLEKDIADAIEATPEIAGEWAVLEAWQKEVETSALSSNVSTDFLQSCNFAGQRYVDYRGPMLTLLKQNRLRFLVLLAENFL